MALRLSPLTIKLHKPPHALVIARFPRVYFPSVPHSSSIAAHNHHILSTKCKAKSNKAENHPNLESLTQDEQTLQKDLETAIAEEDYTAAAKLRDKLRLLHEDSKASVLAANSRFYNAFRNGDLAGMQSIWYKGDDVYVIHPGAGRISGYDLVMGSWEIVCGAEHEFPIGIDLEDVVVHVRGSVGYVTCVEVVKSRGSSWGKQVATNVFEKVDGVWYICIHHASHVDM